MGHGLGPRGRALRPRYPYGAASTDATCKAVEAYLDKLATQTSTFASAFWQGGDDGPWKLTSFDSAGNATFQPNTSYSGPQKAQVRFVKEVAYTSEAAELSDLQSGKLDLGYVDPAILTAPAAEVRGTGAQSPHPQREVSNVGPCRTPSLSLR
jgi:ABC-type transport system substrate-binding protein